MAASSSSDRPLTDVPHDSLEQITGPRGSASRTALLRLAAVAIAALLLYLAVRGADWRRIGLLLMSARGEILGAVAMLALLSYYLRALRWRLLLTTSVPVSAGAVFFANMAGYLGNNVLPARMGEVIRTVLICFRSGAGRVFVLTTALVERLVDALALVLIASAMLAIVPAAPPWLREAAVAVSALGLCGLAVLAIAPRFEAGLSGLAARFPWPRWRDRLGAALTAVLAGLRSFHDPRRAAAFGLYTAAIWGLDAIGSVLGARALGLELSLPVAVLLLAALGLASSIPSTPGYVGVYQFAAVTVLPPFGFSRSDALAYILVAQLLSYAVIVPLGLIGLSQHRKLNAPLTTTA